MDKNGNTHSLISGQNASTLKEAHTDGGWLGFNFVDSSVTKDEDKRFFETSYSATMHSKEFVLGKKKEDFIGLTTNQQFFKAPEATVSTFSSPAKREKRVNKNILAAEVLRSASDPQHNTFVQKTWVAGGDPGLRAKMSSYGAKDESGFRTSLQVGTGNNIDKFHNRRVRSEITNIPIFHHILKLR